MLIQVDLRAVERISAEELQSSTVCRRQVLTDCTVNRPAPNISNCDATSVPPGSVGKSRDPRRLDRFKTLQALKAAYRWTTTRGHPEAQRLARRINLHILSLCLPRGNNSRIDLRSEARNQRTFPHRSCCARACPWPNLRYAYLMLF